MTTSEVVQRLAHLIEEVSGNAIPSGHLPFLAEIAARRAAACDRRDVAGYVDALGAGLLGDEWRSLLPLITVKESYLFRTPQHFAGIRDVLLPKLLAARAATRRLRIWSAGCARGEEPVTLAIVLAEYAPLASWSWQIDATDVDEEALAAGRRGLFGERAVALVPAELRSRYFVRQGDQHELSPELQAHIDYRGVNLIHEPFPVPAEPYDLILLRNVLIYFRPESQRRVVAGMARSLATPGFLFLGPSETLWQLSDALVPLDLEECFCYHHAPASPRPNRGAPPSSGVTLQPSRPGSAREGLRAGARPVPAGRPESAPARAVKPAAVEPVSTRERLAAAGAHLAANRLAEAAEQIEAALRGEPADPTARAIEGVLHDVSGRTELAVASYRATLFLDPALFQVRLLLADALRRLGFADRARHEYREALRGLAAPRPRELPALPGVPLPTAEQAAQRARAALRQE
ncbi:MAG: hypothetical protein HY825_08030 [Acidobacteria bacterium]|nr:hypothetical protein [Acidobacteriota bacterium]